MAHNFMQTISGRRVFIDPDDQTIVNGSSSILIDDAIHALPHINRYNGHTIYPYSVAQHSIAVCRTLERLGHSPKLCAWGLIHDFAEAYIGDVISPVKRLVPLGVKQLEKDILATIGVRSGIGPNNYQAVKWLDTAIQAYEMHHLADERSKANAWWCREPTLEAYIDPREFAQTPISEVRSALKRLVDKYGIV